MKEKDLIRAVNSHLPPAVYRHSNTWSSMTGNGIPDYYYDGAKRDLWVEWKQLASWPKNGLVGGVAPKKNGHFTPQQYDWMKRRWENGKNVFGIIGLPNGLAVVLTSPTEWHDGAAWRGRDITRAKVANAIYYFCMKGSLCHLSGSP